MIIAVFLLKILFTTLIVTLIKTKPMEIEEWINEIISGVYGFEVMEECEFVVHNVSRETSLVSFVIRALANPECEGSDEVLSKILEQRKYLNTQT